MTASNYVDPKRGSGKPRPKKTSEHAKGTNGSSVELWREGVFSLDDDRSLVRGRCFSPTTTFHDLEKSFLTKYGVLVDKNKRSTGASEAACTIFSPYSLQTRLEQLKQPELSGRLSLLIGVIEEEEGRKGHLTLLPDYRKYTISQGDTPETKFPPCETSCSLGNSNIRIIVTTRKLPKYQREGNLEQLASISTAIHDAVADTGISRSECPVSYNPGMSTLTLTDRLPRYHEVETFDHLESSIVDRFLSFSKDPSIVQKAIATEKMAKAMERRREAAFERLNAALSRELQKHTEALSELQEEEFDKICEVLDRKLEADLQAIRNSHALARNIEWSKLQARYAARIESLKSFYSREMDAAADMIDRVDRGQTKMVIDDCASYEKKIDALLGGGVALRLLLLAEELDAEPLRKACCVYVTKMNSFQRFAFRRELSSSLISESTLLNVIQNVPSRDLSDLLSEGSKYALSVLTHKELDSRKLSLAGDLRKLPNKVLRKLIEQLQARGGAMEEESELCGPEESQRRRLDPFSGRTFESSIVHFHADKSDPLHASFAGILTEARVFPDLVNAELAQRRRFVKVCIDERSLSDKLLLSFDHLTVQLESIHRYATAVASTPRSAGQFGRWMFEVTVEAMDTNGGNILVGWDVQRQRVAPAEHRSRGDLVSDKENASSLVNQGDGGERLRDGDENLVGRSSAESWASSGSAPFSAESLRQGDQVIPGVTPNEKNEFGITWQSDGQEGVMEVADGRVIDLGVGLLHIDGATVTGMPVFSAGDTIGCCLNQDSAVPYVQFFLNGQRVIPASSSRKHLEKVLSSVTMPSPWRAELEADDFGRLPLINFNYHIVPSVCMYSTTKGSTSRVSFNFKGPFSFPVPGYEAYGSEWPDKL